MSAAKKSGAAHLSEIRRQRHEWQRQASSNLAEGHCADAIEAYRQQGFVSTAIDKPESIAKLAQDYVADMELSGGDVSRLALSHRRKDVHAINQAIRFLRKSGGDLTVETLFQTDHARALLLLVIELLSPVMTVILGLKMVVSAWWKKLIMPNFVCAWIPMVVIKPDQSQ